MTILGEEHGVLYIPGGTKDSCWVCGGPAQYVDYSFHAAVCGGICIWASWEALRLHDTPWRAW